MINLLTDDLPVTVDIDGQTYSIYTDFRDYIELQQMLIDKTVDIYVFHYILGLYMNERPDTVKAVKAIKEFMRCGKEQNGSHSHPAGRSRFAFSFKYDAPYILGAFLECYHIDLMQIKYLHWWKFNALLDALNEDTMLKKRMSYRMIDTSKIKNKTEKNRIKKIQKQIAIPAETLSDEEIASVF